MRSTITLYLAGSPMRVPPSFTNSAATPSFLPSSFTRTINAGGKLYSRPQRRPIFFICALLPGSCGITLRDPVNSPRAPRKGAARSRRRGTRRPEGGDAENEGPDLGCNAVKQGKYLRYHGRKNETQEMNMHRADTR